MAPRAQRCAYRVGNRRCPRNGHGNPPLCKACQKKFDAEHHRGEPMSAVGDLLGRVISGKRITENDFRAVLGEVAGMFGARPQAPRGHERDPLPWTSTTPPQGQPRDPINNGPGHYRAPPPPPIDELALKKKAIAQACRKLGLNPKELNKDVLTLRRRELAKKFHPDRKGGSTAKMQEINQAVDFLLETVDS